MNQMQKNSLYFTILFFFINTSILLAQTDKNKNSLPFSRETDIVYTLKKNKNVSEYIILKKTDANYYYQTSTFPNTRLIKDEQKSTEKKQYFTLEGYGNDYVFIIKDFTMLGRVEWGTIMWEVPTSIERIKKNGSKAVFRLVE